MAEPTAPALPWYLPETAPKDGSFFLGYCYGPGELVVRMLDDLWVNSDSGEPVALLRWMPLPVPPDFEVHP